MKIEETIKNILISQMAEKNKQKEDWDRYTTKKATIFNRVLPNKQKIDNKINHDYVGVIINTKVGHFLGNSISITLDNDETGNYSRELIKFRRYTAFDRVLTELGVQASVYGYGCCLAYIDEKGKFDFIEIEPYSCYFSDNLVFRIINDIDDSGKEIKIIEAYDKLKKYFYLYDDTDVVPLTEYKGIASGMNHLFNDIPLFKFKNNKEEISETYRVRNIIAVLDKAWSDLLSELEQFRLAYIIFSGVDVPVEMVDAMIQTGIISFGDSYPEARAEFLTKQVNIQGTLDAIRAEEENIFKFAQTYDSQKNREGMGQLTNLGIHFMLSPLNNNCKKTIHYFKESLYKLFDFYSQTKEGEWLNPLEISFDFVLDTPRNLLEESQVQRNLDGLVSTETRLKLATFIDNACIEQEKMKKEKDALENYEMGCGAWKS